MLEKLWPFDNGKAIRIHPQSQLGCRLCDTIVSYFSSLLSVTDFDVRCELFRPWSSSFGDLLFRFTPCNSQGVGLHDGLHLAVREWDPQGTSQYQFDDSLRLTWQKTLTPTQWHLTVVGYRLI